MIGRVKSIHDPTEPLTPASLYVAISTLTGSILTRTRTLPIRFITPPIFFFASLSYFLPKTSTNLNTYLGSLEDKYLPQVAHVHDTGKAHSSMGWEMLKERVGEGQEGARRGLEGVLKKVQETTGLKVREAWDASGKAEGKIVGMVREAREKAREEYKVAVAETKHVGEELAKRERAAEGKAREIAGEVKEAGKKAYQDVVEETKMVGEALAHREKAAGEELKPKVEAAVAEAKAEAIEVSKKTVEEPEQPPKHLV